VSQALIEGIDFYHDEHGYMVLTEKYHLDKGHCCGLGCRHCPYQYESVPEPRRSELLKVREDNHNHLS
jgi:hypothetical protein